MLLRRLRLPVVLGMSRRVPTRRLIRVQPSPFALPILTRRGRVVGMCGRFTLRKSAEVIAAYFQAHVIPSTAGAG